MDEKALDEFCEKHALIIGCDVDELKYLIKNIQAFADSLRESIINVWSSIKESVNKWMGGMNKTIERDESCWKVDWDTRKKSQVLVNKPRFIIRKII